MIADWYGLLARGTTFAFVSIQDYLELAEFSLSLLRGKVDSSGSATVNLLTDLCVFPSALRKEYGRLW